MLPPAPMSETHSRRLDADPSPSPPVQHRYPLTPLQHGMLVQTLLDPAAGVNVEQVVCRLREAVDAERMERAWTRAVQRHDVLRTRFAWADLPEPVQEVLPHVPLALHRQDWGAVPPAEREARLDGWLAADRARGFDLADAPAMRLALFRFGPDEHVLAWSFHHALLDGRSVAHVLGDAFGDYDGEGAGDAPAPRPFREHVAWLRARDPSEDEAYWTRVLRGAGPAEPLPMLRMEPRGPAEPAFAEREVRLSAGATAALRRLEQAQGVWLSSVVQGAWALLLGRYTGSGAPVFGVIRGGRGAGVQGADGMVGLLINTVPVRVPLPARTAVIDWLDEIGEANAALLAHEHAALPDIRRWTGLHAGDALFESILDYQPRPFDAALRALGGPWEGRGVRVLRHPGAPLAVAVTGETPLRVRIGYDTERFDAAAVDAILGHFVHILDQVAADPERRLAELDPLPPAERARVLDAWNRTEAAHHAGALVPEQVAARAAATPDAVAVTRDERTLTYGELDARSNQLARWLRRRGVGTDTRVGLFLERGPELVTAMLGVWKAGGAYVPLDTGYPAERLAFILADSAVGVVLTQDRLSPALPAADAEIIRLDTEWPAVAAESVDTLPGGAEPRGLAYVIYTSGSTGTPKGVAVEHRGLRNLCAWHARAHGLTAADRVTQMASPAFDASALEIWPALARGARVQVVPDAVRMDPERLRGWIVRHGSTIATAVVTVAEPLMALEWPRDAALRWIVAGADRLQARPGPGVPFGLTNNYAPTECTIIATCAVVEREGTRAPSIGRPVDNTRAYVLDGEMRPVPAGVAGELFIGGVQVARGYIRRPALTAERFVPDPFGGEAGARLYRTGDRARWLADGTLDFLGRVDAQVKIRGFRVEPGEIEAALRGHPDVADCAVVVREDAARADVPGERRLVAYVVGGAPADALRGHLRRTLPEYMVPAAFVALAELPLNANGKVDRKALPAPDPAPAEAEYVAPRGPVEEALAGIWAEVLGRGRVGATDRFLEIGGHSLLATRVVARVREVFDGDVGVAALLHPHATVASLAPRLSERTPVAVAERPAGWIAEADASPHRLLSVLDELSDEELDLLLQSEPDLRGG